jgi:hypothetical protein
MRGEGLFLFPFFFCLHSKGTRMGNQVLTLSRRGFLTDPQEKADRLMAYYLSSDKSQSFLYNGLILSFQGTIQQVGNNNAQGLQNQITSDLNTLFGSAFDAVNAVVSITTPATDGTYRYNIAISVQITEDGNTYQLPELLFSSANGITQQLIALNNG